MRVRWQGFRPGAALKVEFGTLAGNLCRRQGEQQLHEDEATITWEAGVRLRPSLHRQAWLQPLLHGLVVLAGSHRGNLRYSDGRRG